VTGDSRSRDVQVDAPATPEPFPILLFCGESPVGDLDRLPSHRDNSGRWQAE
jgi:hypothetical protein